MEQIKILLDKDNRCIGVDNYEGEGTVINVNKNDLPVTYSVFLETYMSYKYIGNVFVYELAEGDLGVNIQLDINNRIVAMDCSYAPTDTVIKVTRKDLPLSYVEFSKVADSYKYVNGAFVLDPISYDPDPLESIQEELKRQGDALQEVIMLMLGGE